ncbi:hypothetical protein BSKO_14063 [Bryopsis sp. KO-2023]|nr:hypothetical protein BSKO_14063 [Bryopsis sp. KO-2023]
MRSSASRPGVAGLGETALNCFAAPRRSANSGRCSRRLLISRPQAPRNESSSRSEELSRVVRGRRGLTSRATGNDDAARGSVATLENARGVDCELKAVIFDMDGVLCDSEELTARAAVHCFKEKYGVDAKEDDFVPFRGMGEIIYLGSVAEKYDLDVEIEVLKKDFYKIFKEQYAVPGAGIGYPGAVDLVKSCKDAGLKVALASSADRVKVEASLEASDIPMDLFDVAFTGTDGIKNLKPAPDIFLAAAEKLGVDPKNCVVIEDSKPGVQAAKAAGMACVSVATTITEDLLLEKGADGIYGSIKDIQVGDLKTGLENWTAKKQLATPQQVEWLEEMVNLPGGYKTSRRDALKFLNLGVIFFSGYVLVSRAKAMSFASPKGVLNLLNPFAAKMETESGGTRVDAFKRFIVDLEKKGGGEIVPEFPKGVDWFNAPPLRLSRELKGKITVLDFWTYCCINCMHVLPDLAAIEKRFEGKPVSVVGVHSAKFDNEKDSDAIRSAVLRYDVTHPVLNDGNMVMWRGLGVSSWPTLAVVGPRGNLLFFLTGEGHRQDLDDLITAALDVYGKRGELDFTPVPESLEREKDSKQLQSPLRFPGKMDADLAGNRLFISDSNNHRIVITDLDGKFVSQIGGNGAKLVDGNFETCAFNRPQGVAFDEKRNRLYVADTENHALRVVDLVGGTVSTLAGNGYQGRDYRGGGKGRNQQLSSPWDVELDAQRENVYIAMAGQHQIWKHDFLSGSTANFSGTGQERNKNGENSRSTAWAQPSGLSLSKDGNLMYVADSESSSIRSLNLETGGSRACVGGDNMFADNLFRFGDRDGGGSNALLQHPLGVCVADDGKVFVADSYNHKVKILDPSANSVASLVGSGQIGFADGSGGSAKLAEPGGLTRGPKGSMLVADTNNNLIRVIQDGKITTKELVGVPAPRASPLESDVDVSDSPPAGKVVTSEAITTTSGQIEVLVKFPQGYGFTEGANSKFSAVVKGPSSAEVSITPQSGSLSENKSGPTRITFKGPRSMGGSNNRIQIDAKLYFCEEGKECLFEEVRFEVPFAQSLTSGSSVTQVVTTPSRAAPPAGPLV